MWRVGVASLAVALFASSPVIAQTGTITGTISSTGGSPVAGAQVVVGGTRLGAVSRDNGQYTISGVNPGSYTLRATRIGFAPDTQTVTVQPGGTATVNFTLETSAAQLSGVVVIGYGEQRAREVTSSVATVTPKDFNQGRVVSADQLIRAKVPGVQIVDNNEPGGGTSIRIRGGTSVNASDEPLFVVDGVPLAVGGGLSAGRNPLNFMDPNDIESITVLKDASATAIYGSRGANGVIIITTKTGKTGPRFTYSVSASTATVDRNPQMLTAAQFKTAVAAQDPSRSAILGSANTNWLDQVEQSGTGQQHELAMGGSNNDANYRLSAGYLDQNGVVRGTELKRTSAALSYSDQLFAHRLSVQANVKASRQHDWFTPGGVLGMAAAFAPTQPVVDNTGAYFEWNDNLAPANPVAEIAQVTDQGVTDRSVGNVLGKYSVPFLDGLTWTANLGYDIANSQRTQFYPSTEITQQRGGTGGFFGRSNPSQTNTVFETYGNYARELFPQQNLELTGGYSYEQAEQESPYVSVQGLATDYLGQYGVIPSGTATILPSLYVDQSRLISFFGRANYAIKDKYMAAVSVRRDGSSKFGVNKQWGLFPAVSAGWRISEESWFPKFGDKLSDLKLRASWGVNGNQAFGNYLAVANYTVSNSAAEAQFGNTFVPTLRPSTTNSNLQWEQTSSVDGGVDFGVWSNRVTGTIDYYTKKTTNLIFTVPVAAGTNTGDFQTQNIGEMSNSGLELGLNAAIFDGGRKGFGWDANFNAATNSNKLDKIYQPGQKIGVGFISGGVGNTVEVLEPGYPVNSFLVYQTKKAANGTYDENNLYVDTNGDGVINDKDRRPFHSPQPKWILGQSSNFRWNGFDASYTLRSYVGNYVYNNVASNLGNYRQLTLGQSPTNLESSVLKTGFYNPQYWSDVYVENASFLRLDNITVGYTFDHINQVQSLRLFGTIQNAFTITGYSGVDPTAGVNGIDNNIYPRSRTLLTGASIQF